MESSGFLASFGACLRRVEVALHAPALHDRPAAAFADALRARHVLPDLRMQAGTPWETCRTQDKRDRSPIRRPHLHIRLASCRLNRHQRRPRLATGNWTSCAHNSPCGRIVHASRRSSPRHRRAFPISAGTANSAKRAGRSTLPPADLLSRPSRDSSVWGRSPPAIPRLGHVGPRASFVTSSKHSHSIRPKPIAQHFMSIKHFERPVETKTSTATLRCIRTDITPTAHLGRQAFGAFR